MVLSNLTNNVDLESRTIATMGDTLGNSWGVNRVMTEEKAFCKLYLLSLVFF